MSKRTVNILLSWLGTKDIDNMLDGEKNASISTIAINSQTPFDKIVIFPKKNPKKNEFSPKNPDFSPKKIVFAQISFFLAKSALRADFPKKKNGKNPPKKCAASRRFSQKK